MYMYYCICMCISVHSVHMLIKNWTYFYLLNVFQFMNHFLSDLCICYYVLLPNMHVCIQKL